LIGVADNAQLRVTKIRRLSMRRKPGSTAVVRIDPEYHRRRCVGGSTLRSVLPQERSKADPPSSRKAPKSRLGHLVLPKVSTTAGGPQIVDDFFEIVPVTQRELDVIETYLSTLLDEMLGRVE
jgi:hypothetical protein